jgi:NDP-sugar pyrophosphorylase family protein
MFAVILAEGEGVRLRPLTETTPKPLLKIAGVPLIQYTIELFEQHGIRDIIICTSYKREMIREALGDGSQLGVKIQYSEAEQPSGTGGALKKAAWMLNPGERFFVANSDEIKEIDLYALRRFHEDSNADATIALTRVDDVRQFGAVKVDGRRVVEFLEKPKTDNPVPGLINSGLYLFEPRVLDLIPSYDKPMLEKAVFPKLASRGKLFGFPFNGRWITINTLEQYQSAERMIRS